MTLLDSLHADLRFLGDLDFPAHRDDLVLAARRRGAGRATVDRLRRLPDRCFEGVYDIARTLPND